MNLYFWPGAVESGSASVWAMKNKFRLYFLDIIDLTGFFNFTGTLVKFVKQ